MNSKLITKKEVSRILNVSPSSVSRWVKNGHLIQPFRLGPNRIVWDKEQLLLWIEEQKKNTGFLGRKPQRLLH